MYRILHAGILADSSGRNVSEPYQLGKLKDHVDPFTMITYVLSSWLSNLLQVQKDPPEQRPDLTKVNPDESAKVSHGCLSFEGSERHRITVSLFPGDGGQRGI